jgi:hypothetical protein
VWGANAFSSTLPTFLIMPNSASITIEQINRMHNVFTHNKKDTLRHNKTLKKNIFNFNDAPSKSLKDSNVNMKVIVEEERIEVRSLIHNTSRVKGVC